MIRGRFMSSNDDCQQIFALRRRVFGDELGYSQACIRDEYDVMAYYALVFDEEGSPAGTGRLTLIDDRFVIGKLCVIREMRGQGLGDLVMRMLLVRVQEMGAPSVFIRARIEALDFYRRYGFAPTGELEDVEGQPHEWMRALADEINIEGKCHAERQPG